MTGSEIHDDAAPEDEPATPVSWRLGKLTTIFLVIVGVGLAINWAVTDADTPPGEGTANTFDVSSFPGGALSGEPAPHLAFPLFDGGTFDLHKHFADDGRPVVLNFWASWCFPCRTEMPEFSEIADRNPDVLFVGVAVGDGREAAEEFADEVRVSYPLGIDEDDTVADSYPYIGLPTTYLIAADGSVTHQIQGQITGEALQAFLDFDFDT